MKFRANKAVAVLAGMRALIFPHHGKGFFGDLAHFCDICAVFHVQYGAYMQSADGSMRIPCAVGAMFFKNVGEPVGVFGKIVKFNGTILNKGDRFTVSLHGHHDIEAGFADFPNFALKGGIGCLQHGARKTVISHEFNKLLKFTQLLCTVISGKFDQ